MTMLPTLIPANGMRLLKVHEVAQRLDRSKSCVDTIIDCGELTACSLGGEKRVLEEDLNAYIAKLSKARTIRLSSVS